MFKAIRRKADPEELESTSVTTTRRSDTSIESWYSGQSGTARFNEEEDYYLKFNATAGWRTLLLLQFNLQMYILILIYLYLWFGTAIFMVAFSFGTKEENITRSMDDTLKGVLYAGDIGYFIDWICMVVFKNVKWTDLNIKYKPRHGFVLFVELVSIIPYELIYEALVTPNMRVFHCLRLRYTLRISRFCLYFKHCKEYVGNYEILMYLLMYFGILSLVVITASGIHYVTQCQEKCDYANMTVLSEVVYNTFSSISFCGVKTMTPEYVVILDTPFASLLFFFVGILFGSFFICDILQSMGPRFVMASMYRRCKKRIEEWKKTMEWGGYYMNFQRLVNEHSEISKLKVKGVSPAFQLILLPIILQKDLALDISWAALKHTHVFANEDVFFLRAVADKMVHKFLCPGEVIFKKNVNKNALVYIIAGNVDVLSEEDGETPILTFTSGTCLGEATLAFGYPSVSTVVSKDVSDVAILEHSALIQVAKLYPMEIRRIFYTIMQRYDKARSFRSVREYQYSHSTTRERIGVMSLKWLKFTLRKLLYDDKIKIEHMYSKDVVDELEEHVFCTDYLDLLVQSEQMGIVADTTFVRTTFPIIFRPTSLMLNVWRFSILMHVLVFALLFPFIFIYLTILPFICKLFHAYITFVWLLDVYVQSSTAVKTKFVECNTIGDIFLYKLGHWTFFVDMIAALPLELVMYIMNGSFTRQDAIIASSNRLLKLYRLEIFFGNLQMTGKLTAFIIYFKYFLYFFFTVYYTATLFYMLGHSQVNEQMYEKYLATFSVTSNLTDSIYYTFILALAYLRDMCFFEFPFFLGFETTIPLMIAMVCFETFFFFVIGHTTANEAMKCIDEHATNEFMRNVEVTMEVYDFEKSLRSRIMDYIDLHLIAMGDSFLFESKLFTQLPKDLYIISKGISPGLFMKNLQFFYHLDDKIVHTMAASGSVDLILPRETFKPKDEICHDVYVLINGFCEVKHLTGEIRTVGPGESFCVLEAALGLRSLVQITSLTTCRILTLHYNDLKRILFKYPKEYRYLEETVKYFPYWEELENLVNMESKVTFSKTVYVSQPLPSFKRYQFHGKQRTPSYYEFVTGFPFWAHFLRYFLLKVTFHSSGKFVFYWEFFHSASVLAYIFCLYLSLIVGPSDPRWIISRSVFEFFGVIDIYLRHHFSYYNSDNLEICHPYKTSIYYWKHGFLVDVIGWFPFEWVFFKYGMHSLLWRLNRLLQLYRVFAFVSFITFRKRNLRGCWKMLTYTPIIILVMNVINYVLLRNFCNRIGNGYECIQDTWLSTLNTTSTFEIYMYNLMFVSILITGSNNHFIQLHKSIEMNAYLILLSLGFVLYVIFCAKTVAANLAINRDLCKYQEAMQSLIKFLNYLKIDKKLKWETVKHYEYIWAMIRGKNIVKTFSVFKSYFKIDLLYEIYGKPFRKSTIFLMPNENFFRALLSEAKHELYLKTGIIYQVNDISGDIFILTKGKVEIVGADLHRLETLHVGSIFGNLDMVQRGRRTLSAVTSGHVEVLKVDSLVFYKHLSKFPTMLKHFRKLTRFHVDYIQEKNYQNRAESSEAYRIPSEVLHVLYKQQVKKHCQPKVFKSNILIRIWENHVLNIVYFLNYMMELVNISSEIHYSIYVFLYFFDAMHILKIYLRLHTSYDDEYGRTIRLRRMIFKRYKRERFGLFFDLATLVPLEIVSLFFINQTHFFTVLSICRINRLPRILFTLVYCKQMTQRLNVNVIFVRFRYLFLWVFLVQFNFAFFLKLTHTSPGEGEIRGIELFLHYMHIVIAASRHVSADRIAIDNMARLCLLNLTLIGATIVHFMFMAECCAIILLLTHTSSLYKHFVLYTKRFMETENVSTPLVQRIENYMDLLWIHHKAVQFPKLLQETPRYLKEGVLYSMFGNHLMRNPVLKHCHKDLTRQICLYMKTLVFFPGDNIAYIGDIDKCMYFIQEGEVHALSEDTMYSEVKEFTLTGGDMFGLDQGLYPRCGHDYTYRCITYTIVVVLHRDDWIHLLDFFPATKRMIYDTSREQ